MYREWPLSHRGVALIVPDNRGIPPERSVIGYAESDCRVVLPGLGWIIFVHVN